MKHNEKIKHRTLAGLSLMVMIGCAEDIKPNDMNMNMNMNTDLGGPEITITEKAGDVTEAQINASGNDAWVYLDLESKKQVTTMTPDSDSGWDLAFKRVKVKTNSGISGTGDVKVARLSETDFGTLTDAPTSGYVQDSEDSDDADTDPDYAFYTPSTWYDYSGPPDHTITPGAYTYIVKTVEGNFYKLRFTDYYDAAGTSGYPKIEWAPVTKPSGMLTEDRAILINASERGTWIYVDLIDGAIRTVMDPKNSSDWDIAISRTQIQTNSGTSGNAMAGALAVEQGKTWDETEKSPTIGFARDSMMPLPGPPGSGEYSGNAVLNTWYNYDPITHEVSAKDQLFLVRTAEGDYVKFKILSYDGDGTYTVKAKSIERDPKTHTTIIDASDREVFTHFNFESNSVSETSMDTKSDLGWDIAIQRTKMRTNSGTSGTGKGGALESESADLNAIATVPAGDGCYLASMNHTCDCGYSKSECEQMMGAWTPQCNCPTKFVEDAELPIPGPPGSGTYSGNAVLAEWYNYNHMTHQVSPNETAFIVRTAHGDFVKMKVTNWDDGKLTVDWVYAGPGHSNF
ncbi:MAG: HmuY family protein [Myxococcota bacterium]|nr:HmuY family protein [Myxococcota bacterium]